MPRRIARANARKSAVRSAVEHVFARRKGPMGLFIRTIGMARARTKIGLANLLYNMQRIIGGLQLVGARMQRQIPRLSPLPATFKCGTPRRVFLKSLTLSLHSSSRRSA